MLLHYSLEVEKDLWVFLNLRVQLWIELPQLIHVNFALQFFQCQRRFLIYCLIQFSI